MVPMQYKKTVESFNLDLKLVLVGYIIQERM